MPIRSESSTSNEDPTRIQRGLADSDGIRIQDPSWNTGRPNVPLFSVLSCIFSLEAWKIPQGLAVINEGLKNITGS